MKHSAVLYQPAQAHAVLQSLWASIKPHLMAGHRLVVKVEPEKRSLDQNAKFHAMCEDFAKSGIKWAGKTRTKAGWKNLLVSGHAVATEAETEIVPGLEGEFVNIRESTAEMAKGRKSSLIEYSMAWGVELGVQFRESP
jgi:hypothetical protein